jgi:predicted ArsR family transcriptional regulator
MMHRGSAARAVDTGEEIFNLLKRRGPLCASQIAVEVGVSLRNLEPVLHRLQTDGVIELRPDRDRSLPYDESEKPWGLIRPSWLRRAH